MASDNNLENGDVKLSEEDARLLIKTIEDVEREEADEQERLRNGRQNA